MYSPTTFFDIFDSTKRVSVSTTLVEEYEKYNQPVKIYTIEYLILVEGGNKNLSEKELSALLKKSMEYEVYFRTHNADEVQKALEKGGVYLWNI